MSSCYICFSIWFNEGSLEIDELKLTKTSFSFKVTKCKFADMYKALGMEELGFVLSCNRDGHIAKGFSSDIEFIRERTIMEGDDYCDFKYIEKK